MVQARAARLADTAALFQALGGGWWNRPAPPTEKILNVGTGQAETVTGKDKKEGFLKGLVAFCQGPRRVIEGRVRYFDAYPTIPRRLA